jgi:oligopeptide/dipeptide ABC transporter ATP-binding protein
MAGDLLLSVSDLEVRFNTEDGVVQAVSGISFDINRGQVFAVVGESGSGKSVTAMSILGLLPMPPAEVTGGSIVWQGEDLLGVSPERMREVRGGEIAMIFQDPLTALNPVHTVGRQIGEMVRIHRSASKAEARARAIETLELVGIPQPDKRVDMHPHEFSGGMRQRVMIAMAIACSPALLIADEPTTALDVTVQAQVLDVLLGIKDEIDSAIMLITHDLGVVAGVADDVMVMYAGRQVEYGTVDEIFYESSHPYTVGLLDSVPSLGGTDHELRPIGGQPPSLIHPPSGCAFHPRCRFAELPEPCATQEPTLVEVGVGRHLASCHFADAVRSQTTGVAR